MLKRLCPILPDLRFSGYFVLVWTMLAHGSTAQFSLWIISVMNGWLKNNAWAGFVVGLGLLALAVFWPGIRQHIPRLRKSDEDRISDIDGNDIPRLAQRGIDNTQQISVLSESLSTGLSDVNRRLDEQRSWLSDMRSEVTHDIQQSISKLEIFSDRHGEFLSNLLKRLEFVENERKTSL